MCVYTYIYIYVNLCICVYIYICIYVYIYIDTHTYIYVYVYVYICMYLYIYIYIHIQGCPTVRLPASASVAWPGLASWWFLGLSVASVEVLGGVCSRDPTPCHANGCS